MFVGTWGGHLEPCPYVLEELVARSCPHPVEVMLEPEGNPTQVATHTHRRETSWGLCGGFVLVAYTREKETQGIVG